MIIPIRCFTCGRPLGHLYAVFKKRVLAGEHPGAVFDSLGVTRYCCRRTLMAHVEWIEDLLVYEKRI